MSNEFLQTQEGECIGDGWMDLKRATKPKVAYVFFEKNIRKDPYPYVARRMVGIINEINYVLILNLLN